MTGMRDEIQILILAVFAVFAGSLARRARELDRMTQVTSRSLIRMFGIELMLMPAFASLSAYGVIYYGLSPIAVLPIGIGAGLGGFATGTLIYELWSSVITRLALRTDGHGDGKD